MIGLIQRVAHASVTVDEQVVGHINQGVLALIGVEKKDTAQTAQRLAERLLSYRIFPDHEDKMNLSLRDIHGELLLVPQFTLAASTDRGTRPSFSSSAPPAIAEHLFDTLYTHCQALYDGRIETGQFGADMQVNLLNDGPVTFWLQIPAKAD